MSSPARIVIRNKRFQGIGALSLAFAAGLVVLTYLVFTSPGYSVDHPGGFTGAGRALAGFGCILALLTFATYGVGALRVVLVLDEHGLLIRNPWRTTTVGWDVKPRFDVRGREQDVTVISPNTSGGPWVRGNMRYRYRAIECVVGRQRTWIAATSRMTRRDRVDQRLDALRQAAGQFRRQAAEPVND